MVKENLKYRILISGPSDEKIHEKENLKMIWMETFNDSKAYVDLIYDTYLENALIGICETEQGRMIASLTAIPYLFQNSESSQIGWYLCGLATVPEFRGRGIMGQLMKMAEEHIYNEKGNFSFLIPADNRLEKYYSRKGYRSIPRRRLELKRDHRSMVTDTDSNGENSTADTYILTSITDATELSEKELWSLIKFLGNIEGAEIDRLPRDVVKLRHLSGDWKKIIEENSISGGEIYVLKSSGKEISSEVANRIKAVAFGFPVGVSGDSKELELRGILSEDDHSGKELLRRLLLRSNVTVLGKTNGLECPESTIKDAEGISVSETEEGYIMVKGKEEYINRNENTLRQNHEVEQWKKEAERQESSESEISIFSTKRRENLKYPIFRNEADSLEICQEYEESLHPGSFTVYEADLMLD